MDDARFEAMVARLERESETAPRAYLVKVALLALLGFAILAFIVGFAGFGLLLLGGFAVALLFMGTGAIVLLLKLGKLLILLAIPLWMLVRSSFASLFVRIPAPRGEEIGRSDAPALHAALDRLRRALRGPRFHHVLVVDEMTAWMTQRPLFGLFGLPRNYLVLGLPMLESLSADEALAVVAHEYGHLAGAHARFGAFIYRLRHIWANLQQVTDTWRGWASKPVQRVVAWYAPYFNAYTFVLARANEYEADRASARLVGAGIAASALKRSNVAAAQYDAFLDTTYKGIGDAAAPPDDLAVRWAAHASSKVPRPLVNEWLAQALGREPALLDTHPALAQRLRALGREAGASDEPPRDPAGPRAAAAWLGDSQATQLRRRFQAQWRERVAEEWAERHAAVQVRKSRLAELRGVAEPSADERLERIRLRIELEPSPADLADLVAYNAEHAGSAPALFEEGTLRLDTGDDAGLPLLDRAMALDGDAIKPACGAAFSFLRKRGGSGDKERAERYADRWRERDAWETQRAGQLSNLDATHELRRADGDLAPADAERVREIVSEERKGIARAWFARRVLPADPALETYVLAIEAAWWLKLLDRQGKLLLRLASREWPVHLQLCVLEGRFKPMKKPLKALGGAELQIR